MSIPRKKERKKERKKRKEKSAVVKDGSMAEYFEVFLLELVNASICSTKETRKSFKPQRTQFFVFT